jgi:very-short-patch-repair endonuclease
MQGLPVTSEEISRIKNLRLLGLSIYEIGKQLNRAPSFVFGRIRSLGLQSCLDRTGNGKKAWETKRKKFGRSGCSPEGLQKRIRYCREHFSDERNPSHRADVRQKISLAQKGVPCPQRGRKGKIISLAQRQRLSELCKKRFADPRNHPLYGKPRSEESKEKQRKAMSGRKQALEQVERRIRASMKAQHRHPNKPEKELAELLEKTFPNEYRYVGDGSFILGGKCPDFLNVNGKKKIIEVFGIYWHKKSEEEERKALFKQYGFDTLIVWDSELDNVPVLSEKLMEFHSGEQS